MNIYSKLKFLFYFLLITCAGFVHAQTNTARPKLLEALDGSWIMSGDVKGKPVTYTMEANSTLLGAFTEMRMLDVQIPAQYAAHVFIGYDQPTQSVIVHWIDSFGAKYSIPHGTGSIKENTLQFIIPYSGGQFRDTFTFHPETGHWTFVLEFMKPDGTWAHFAKFKAEKKTPR